MNVFVAATVAPTPAPSTGSTVDTTTDKVVHWLTGAPLLILVIVITAVVSRWLAHRAIDAAVVRASKRRESHEQSAQMLRAPLDQLVPTERRQQRAQAVGALLKSITTAVVFGIAFVTILGQLGVDLGPLIASAGIAGIALGFGAQTLVRDFLSGVFMIMEDQYGVGDVIDTGFAVGTVEDVGLRVTRVRDMNGVVWYVRNGEILRIGNRSQGWVLAVADIPVAYDEDLERVRTIVDRIGQELADDTDWHDRLLAPPELAGVESVAGDAVVVRITARTAPLQQTPVARELRERLKAAFDREGVRVPSLYRPADRPGERPPSA